MQHRGSRGNGLGKKWKLKGDPVATRARANKCNAFIMIFFYNFYTIIIIAYAVLHVGAHAVYEFHYKTGTRSERVNGSVSNPVPLAILSMTKGRKDLLSSLHMTCSVLSAQVHVVAN